MLSIVNGIGAQPQCYHWDYAQSIQDNIALHLPNGDGWQVAINGDFVDHPEDDARLGWMPVAGDQVVLFRRPAGIGAAIATSWYYYAVVAVVVAVAVTLLMPKPQLPGDVGGKDSPNNRLTGQTNIARAYQAVPDVYGQVRSYPDLIQQSVYEYISHIKYVTEWMCMSRGEVLVEDIRYADTPLSQIVGASSTVYHPDHPPSGAYLAEDYPTTITDVYEPFASDDINGQELPPLVIDTVVETATATPITPTNSSATFTITLPDETRWDQLRAKFPGGTQEIQCSWEYSLDGGTIWLTDSYNGIANCVSYVYNSGPDTYTYTFTRATGTFQANTRPKSGANTVFTFYNYNYTYVGWSTLPATGGQIWCHFLFPRGLDGTVDVLIEWQAVDSGGSVIGGTYGSQQSNFSDASYNPRYYTVKISPAAGVQRYQVRLARANEVLGDGLYDQCKIEEVVAIRYYATKVLPSTTIIKVATPATEQATGVKDRKFNALVTRRVRTVSNPVNSSYSRNFARAILHMFTAIAGRDNSEMDVDALTAINTAHGEDSELLRFDYTFDDRDISLGQRIQTACNAARVVDSRVGVQWTFVRDELKTLGPEWQFDYRNLAAGADSAITTRGHLPGSHDGVKLEYVDPTINRKAYVQLQISSTGAISYGTSSNPLEMQLAGCRTLSQAQNRAWLEAARIKYQRASVSDVALQDALILTRGSLVRWVDPNDFTTLVSGEVIGVDGLAIETDTEITWTSEFARVIITDDDGTSSLPVPVYPRYDGKHGFIFTYAPSVTPYVRDGVDKQLGSRFALGFGLTSEAMAAAGLYLVSGIRPTDDGKVGLDLLQYDARMYQYD